MTNFYNKYKWLRLCVGITFLVVGILTIVISYANASIISTTISIAAACIFFLAGGITLVATLLENKTSIYQSSLAISALLIAIGVVLCVKTQLLTGIIVYFMAAYAIGFGVICLIKGVQLIKYKARWYAYVTCFIIAALLLTLGILSLIYEDNVKALVYVFLGCCLIALGVNETIYGIKALR